MRRLALFVLAAAFTARLFSAAPREKPPLPHALMGVANGCFVETVAFLDHWSAVQGADSWARMLQWGAREEEETVIGHAVAVCVSRGALWCWDINHGWTKLPADSGARDNVETVAASVLKKYPKVTARLPLYRFDFVQAPGVEPPAQLTNPNAAIRDAAIVGAQLAQRRPVNVVTFFRGTGEAKQESAAVVFVFHGRFCLYVPEVGTLPFRGRADVANIRVIQDLLRRLFPGVTGVRKLQAGAGG